MTIALLVLGAIALFASLFGLAFWMTRPRPPGDAHAVRLAAELGGSRPTLRETVPGWRWEWCFEVDLEGPHEVCVAADGLGVRRPLRARIGRPARIFTRPRFGRAQEDYGSDRVVIPADDGLFAIGGRPSERPEGWERRVSPSLVEAVAELGSESLDVEEDALALWAGGERDAEWVRQVAAFLAEAERTLRGE